MGIAINHPVPDRVKPSFEIFDIRALWRPRAERQSVRMSKITNDRLIRSGTGCFIGLSQYPYGNSGRQRVKATFVAVSKRDWTCVFKAASNSTGSVSISFQIREGMRVDLHCMKRRYRYSYGIEKINKPVAIFQLVDRQSDYLCHHHHSEMPQHSLLLSTNLYNNTTLFNSSVYMNVVVVQGMCHLPRAF